MAAIIHEPEAGTTFQIPVSTPSDGEYDVTLCSSPTRRGHPQRINRLPRKELTESRSQPAHDGPSSWHSWSPKTKSVVNALMPWHVLVVGRLEPETTDVDVDVTSHLNDNDIHVLGCKLLKKYCAPAFTSYLHSLRCLFSMKPRPSISSMPSHESFKWHKREKPEGSRDFPVNLSCRLWLDSRLAKPNAIINVIINGNSHTHNFIYIYS